MTVLYDYPRSSASYRVRIALGLANEPWETQLVDLLSSEHKSDEHLARNPQGLVPVLEIDGLIITQSLAQIEYLNETRGLGLLPDGAAARAHVRALAYAIAMDIHPICNSSVAKWAAGQSDGNISVESWMRHFISRGLDAYERMLALLEYSFENQVTLADICLMPQLYNAARWGIDLQNFPEISKVKETLDKIPAFVDAHPDNPIRAKTRTHADT